jgi:hypothetical protein
MADFCQLEPLKCLNNGQCAVNISLNTTYCQCDACYEGIICENHMSGQTQFDKTYVYMIVFIIGLCFSILNNILSLELFIGCKRIRRTNCGVYLIFYSIFSLISNILLVLDSTVQYYANQWLTSPQYSVFHCYVDKIGYNMFIYLCIWFSSFILSEHSLVIYYDRQVSPSLWRSLVTIIVILIIAGGSITPLLFYKCDWDLIPALGIVHTFFVWFYIVTGIMIYILATLLILISFTRRIRRYGTEDGSFIKTFRKLLYVHLFIFAPPIAYIIGYIPYTIVYNTTSGNNAYFQCGISTVEFTVKVLIEALQGVPFAVTWLLFVFPSKVYMTEFYLNTWSGRRLARIITFCKQR